jgi:hypothetical protein
MLARVTFLVALIGVALVGCNRPQRPLQAPTDDPNWLLGYHQGLDDGHNDTGAYAGGFKDGIDEGRDQVCDEIRRYNQKMAKTLNDNTEICGWPDMDSPEKSN